MYRDGRFFTCSSLAPPPTVRFDARVVTTAAGGVAWYQGRWGRRERGWPRRQLTAVCAALVTAGLLLDHPGVPVPVQVAVSGAGAVLALALAATSPPRVRAVFLVAGALAAVLAVGSVVSGSSGLVGRLLYLPAVALLAAALRRAWPELADLAGHARERARIAGQEQSRAQLARELHDDALQQLGLTRRRLLTAAGGADASTRAVILDCCALLTEQARSLRAVITDLHPPALTRLGLPAAVEALLDRAETDRPDIRFTLHLEDPGHLGWPRQPDLTLAAYRVIQEALTNALKHSGAVTVTVVLRRDPEHLIAVITDDGTGFDPDTQDVDGLGPTRQNTHHRKPGPVQRHFGLTSMRSRTEANGGTLTISTGPDGTTITADFPLTTPTG